MVGFFEMLAKVEKYAPTKEAYDAHGPPSAPVAREWPPTQEFRSRREDYRKRQRS